MTKHRASDQWHLSRFLVLLTLCGLTSQKTHRGGLGLGGSVHEEAHPCFPYLVQPSFKGIAVEELTDDLSLQ